MPQQALFNPIRRRLVAWAVLVLGLILVLLGTSVYLTVSHSLLDQVDRNLLSRSDQAMGAMLGGPGGPGRPGDPDHAGYHGGTFYVAINSSGQVIANPQQVQFSATQWPTAAPHTPTLSTVQVNAEPTRVLAVGAPDGGTLLIGQSLQPEQAAIHTLMVVLVAGGALGLLLSVLGAWFLSGRALLPIETAFRRQQEFVADASHELRTPLTVLRSAAEILDKHRGDRLADHAELLDDIRAEIVRMEHLTQDLLTLARSDRGELQLMTAPIDLGGLATDVVRRTARLADARAQSMTAEVAASELMVDVDPDRIQQALLILLDNAMKYTPEGGRITVVARAEANCAVLQVSDSGPGIAAEHLPRLFDRFYRADAARSRAAGGTGLGLAIARMLVEAEAHRGTLSVESAPGAGTTVTMRLPLAPQDSSKVVVQSPHQVAALAHFNSVES